MSDPRLSLLIIRVVAIVPYTQRQHYTIATIGFRLISMKMLLPLPSNGQYIDISSGDSDEYNKALCLLDVIVTRYLPFLLVPLFVYLTVTYVYPTIFFHLEQYLKTENSVYLEQYVRLHSDEQKDEMIVVKKLKLFHLECLLVANCYVYFVFMWFYIFPGESVRYISKDFPSTVGDYIAYIFDEAYSAILTMLLSAIVIVAVFNCFKGRKISLTMLTAVSISVNILCLVCFVLPKMLVGFTHDLLYTFTVVVIIVSLYLLIWHLYVLIILLKLHLKQAYFNLFSCKSLSHCLTSVAFMLLFCCTGLIVAIDVMEILRSDSEYFELLCLLINLLLICLVKLVSQCLYDHAIENAKLMVLHVFNYGDSWAEDDEAKISIYDYEGNHDIGINETDDHFRSNKIIVV